MLGTLGLGAAATALLAGCGKNNCDTELGTSQVSTGSASVKTKWKLVTSWPKNFPGLGTAPEKFAQLVNLMTNGQLEITVYGAGELVPALEVFDAVSRGAAEMGHSGAYYWKGKLPASPFFCAVPFGLTAKEMNGWIHFGGGLELWRELYAPAKVLPMAGGNTGVQMAGWFNKEINSIDDMKGLKMRIPGLAGEVFKRIGGTPVSMPGAELFTSLKTGVIDATEWVGPYNDKAFSLHKAARYYYYPGWHEPGAMLELTVNQDAYKQLPSELQHIVEAAARAINQDLCDEYTARNNAALEELVNDHDVQLRPLPADVLKELKVLSEQVVAEIAETSELAGRIYQSYQAFKTAVTSFHDISEKAYLSARDG